MNQLTTERRTAIVRALCEGNSVRATSRLTGAAKATVLKLLVERHGGGGVYAAVRWPTDRRGPHADEAVPGRAR